jgi:hypothetical protein
MSAFCDPVTTTSMSHASWFTGMAPSADTASIASSAPCLWATSARPWMSLTTPVEVSL